MRAAGTRGSGEPHVIGKSVNEKLDHFECPPGSIHPHLPPLKLVAVFVNEIFLAVCTARAAAVKRQLRKHSKEVTRNFNPPPEW
jgi:hypothetical protein